MKILYVQYTNPAAYPPLEHSSLLLAESGWSVRFLGTGAAGANNIQLPPHPNIRSWRFRYCHSRSLRKIHYGCFILWSILITAAWRPDWIYCSDSMSTPIALILTWIGRLRAWRVVYHEHDFPASSPRVLQPPKHSYLGGAAFLSYIRTLAARKSNICVVPNGDRAEIFTRETGRIGKTFTAWNCPSVLEIRSPRPKKFGRDLVIFYHGSIVPNRLPITLLEALARLPDYVFLRFAGYETVGHRGFINELLDIAKLRHCEKRCQFLGTITYRRDLLSECSKADVGLALMPSHSTDINERTMAGASNKPFDYLACGLPLLVTNTPSWNRLFVDTGCAISCTPEDDNSILLALQWYIDHPEETKQMGLRGQRLIQHEWNYEAQFAPIRAEMLDSQ